MCEKRSPTVNVKNSPSSNSNDINLSIPRTRGQLRHTTMIPIPSLASLIGKKVDDSGNIVDEGGDVLGKATGIISDIAGKTVNENGQIVDKDGNVLGKVGEITKDAAEMAKDKPEDDSHDPPNSAAGLVGKVVTDSGCILDESGKVIGRVEGDITEMVGRTVSPTGEIINDANEVVGRVVENLLLSPEDDDPPEEFIGDDENFGKEEAKGGNGNNEDKSGASGAAAAGTSNAGGDTGGDPTDIYLNIQSTKEAITITIRVPTVFRDKFNR